VKKAELGFHVVLQIQFQSSEQEPSSPTILLRSTRPPTGSTNSSFAIIKERHNVRIGLASDEELAIKHFGQSVDRNVLLNGTIEESFSFL
jgi:hypothetical protein